MNVALVWGFTRPTLLVPEFLRPVSLQAGHAKNVRPMLLDAAE